MLSYFFLFCTAYLGTYITGRCVCGVCQDACSLSSTPTAAICHEHTGDNRNIAMVANNAREECSICALSHLFYLFISSFIAQLKS